jgi:retron-type reverse transcriptase
MAYGRLYSNQGAMTPGVDGETVDGMSLGKIGRIIDAMRHERYRFLPARRVYIVRRVAPRRIPCIAGRNLEGGFWVYRLTRCRKADGTRACRRAVAW